MNNTIGLQLVLVLNINNQAKERFYFSFRPQSIPIGEYDKLVYLDYLKKELKSRNLLDKIIDIDTQYLYDSHSEEGKIKEVSYISEEDIIKRAIE